VFYSVTLLPPLWEKASWFNPVLHMVSAFRYGLLGASDVPLWIAYAVMIVFAVALTMLGLTLLRRGVGLRS
jgi:ABC-2 type transport system permease protein